MAPQPTLENLARQAGATRRERPPTMIELDEPLRAEKLNRRESRLGLRSFFGRKGQAKDKSDLKPLPESTSDLAALPAGSRSSFAESTLRAESVRSDLKDLSIHSTKALPQTTETARRPQIRPPPTRTPSKHQSKQQIAAWDAPPLFKAYPQALIHATLPTTVLSPDAILKLREKRNNETPESPNGDGNMDPGVEKEKLRRRKKSDFTTEWTKKTYLLVTSGCLLQYSSEGPFDRAPEKVLQLSKSSAVFVSDAIPGRHWVLQVSSSLEADGIAPAEGRSLFSRLRIAERRQISNYLMVFEKAEDMEDWLSTLRREIEVLGGKKTLSETGKPKTESSSTLREQPSQRTLVVRDPNRFSQTFSIGSGSGWHSIDEGAGIDSMTEGDVIRQQSLDETSATDSFTSNDERQLDSLRNSSHRLSAISSGQRTMITSSGSSPSSSPVRDTFPSPQEEEKHLGDFMQSAELRPRPNAAAIAHRRRSMQNGGPFFEGRSGPQGASRPPSTLVSPPIPEAAVTPPAATPNFSVPHSSNRRFSYMKHAPEQTFQPLPPNRLVGRKPPASLNVSRPLSMVADQPSPLPDSELPERPVTGHGDGGYALTPSAQYPSIASHLPAAPKTLSARRSSYLPREPPSEFDYKHQPRRLSSTSALRPLDGSQPRTYQTQRMPNPQAAPHEDHSQARSVPPVPYMPKRMDSSSMAAERARKRRSDASFPPLPETLPEPAPPPTMPLPPLPTGVSNNKHIQAARMSQQLYSRRSLPHLVEGPPPAPPPSCALPPIPQKHSVRV